MRCFRVAAVASLLAVCSCARAPVALESRRYCYAPQRVSGGVAGVVCPAGQDEAFASLVADEIHRLGLFDRVERLAPGAGAEEARAAGADWTFAWDLVEERKGAPVRGFVSGRRWRQPVLTLYLECRETASGRVVWSAQDTFDGADPAVAASYAAFVEARGIPEEPGVVSSFGTRADDYALGYVPIDEERFARFCVASLLELLPGP